VVLRSFATLWANRSASPSLKVQSQLIGLSGGAWARQVIQELPISLPSISGVHAQGSLVVLKVQASGPGTKTAVVVTEERLVGAGIRGGTYRYTVYLARLDWLSTNGYVVTEWAQQT
jgi:hypothetical protein